MGQMLHGCTTTTEAVRRAIQNSQRSFRGLARRYGINQKTVAKWKQRETVADLPTGPKNAKSTVLSIEEEAIIVAFRQHTLLPLDDCLYALQPHPPSVAVIPASLPPAPRHQPIARGRRQKAREEEVQGLSDRLFPSRHRRTPDFRRQALPLCRDRSHQQVRVRATGEEGGGPRPRPSSKL